MDQMKRKDFDTLRKQNESISSIQREFDDYVENSNAQILSLTSELNRLKNLDTMRSSTWGTADINSKTPSDTEDESHIKYDNDRSDREKVFENGDQTKDAVAELGEEKTELQNDFKFTEHVPSEMSRKVTPKAFFYDVNHYYFYVILYRETIWKSN